MFNISNITVGPIKVLHTTLQPGDIIQLTKAEYLAQAAKPGFKMAVEQKMLRVIEVKAKKSKKKD